MMPELGKYAVYVLSSYAVTLVLMIGLVVLSIARSRRVRAELDKVEKRIKGNG
ncbi:heme exporter protein CcmD [Mesobacterium sp. TK19101]|uniref:Heme exporter protein D n=1 Tax=Mesobacterium hydrothermale TaxID=3111907 RepID=A0ABU6HM66_9RHOB|nr:heme exporter protein CcmD [Mesobacterium sp. TK19101]MEC3862280.1 heme exporter protein CcmD [Mesobacterium sp. TK19101]